MGLFNGGPGMGNTGPMTTDPNANLPQPGQIPAGAQVSQTPDNYAAAVASPSGTGPMTLPDEVPGAPDPNAPPVSPGGGNFGESTDDAVDGATQRQALHDYVLDLSPGGQKSQFIRPEGDSYTGVGGEQGKEWFNEAMVEGPKRLEAAIKQSEIAQGQKSKALGEYYDQESQRSAKAAAQMQYQRAQDQHELQTRQQNLDKATEFYTNDLADQNKFWTNPGNIISTIAYCLMPIVSNDPAIGVKLVNQAVDRDMANRQHAANATLGALTSNLAGYHKIVGDRQAGDLMAESEARRMAAQEVERIAQKFESPISKAKAEAIIQDLRMKSAVTRMEAYKAWGIHQDAKAMPQALHEARGKGFEGEWRKYGSDVGNLDPALRQANGASVNGTVAGTPSTATTDGSRPLSARDAAAFTSPKLALQASLGGRVPGGVGMADVFKRSVARQAMAASGFAANGDQKAFDKAKIEIVNQAEKDIQGFAPMMAPIAEQKAGVTMLQRDMDIIERSEKNPDEFIGRLRSMSPQGFAAWYENMRRQFGGDPSNKAQALEMEKANAAMRFRSLWADTQVDYYHSKAGANQAPGELANLKEVIHSGSSWGQVKAFTNITSIKLDRHAREILAGASNPLAAMMYMTQTGIGTTRLPSQGVPEPKLGLDAAPAPKPRSSTREQGRK